MRRCGSYESITRRKPRTVTIKKTSLEIEFGQAWHTFLQRKVLTTAWQTGFVPDRRSPVRFPPLRELIISLLYIDLVSLLDFAISTQMPPERFEQLGNLHNRINTLAKEGRALDAQRLHAIRERRNDIAHQVWRVELAELEDAIAAVQLQLEAWGLVGRPPRYEAFAERSAARESDRPDSSAMWEWTVGIKRDGRAILAFNWREYLGRDEEG